MENNKATLFWNKFKYLCEKKGVKPNTFGKEMGITSGTITGWKRGAIPNSDALVKISEYFDTTIEFLITDDEIYIKPSHKKSLFKHLFAIPQRWFSLRHGKPFTDEQMDRIVEFTNSTRSFIYSTENHNYEPKNINRHTVTDYSVLEDIMGLLDRCADNDDVKNLQIQLSHIVRYWLNKKGITYDELLNNAKYKTISLEKLEFLYLGKTHLPDVTVDFGFNLTDLDVLRENADCSFLYMFTGHDYKDIYYEKDARIAELEAKVRELGG